MITEASCPVCEKKTARDEDLKKLLACKSEDEMREFFRRVK